MRSVSVEVFGKVQGVWFRSSTAKKAKELRLTGFVCNRSDGSVYLEAHGQKEDIQALVNWCRIGPRHAMVKEIKVSEITFSDTTDFVIKR